MGVPLPQELADKIIDEVAKDPVLRTLIMTLRACSLVSRAWVHRSQKHLFSKVVFEGTNFDYWCSDVRPGKDGPSRHVTHLHCDAGYPDVYPDVFVDHGEYFSYFTNLRTLHLSGAGLHQVEYVFTFMRLRSTVRSLALEKCKMDINDLVTFLRPFTNLESLSIWDPLVPHTKKLEKRVRLPTLGGKLDLKLVPHPGVSSFLRELLLLPLAFRDIALRDHIGLAGEVNQLVTASRKTLTTLRFLSYHPDFIDLTNLDALEALQLNASHVHYIPPILRTITSSNFVTILLTFSDGDLERHLKNPLEWTQLDVELCALVDRIRTSHISSESGDSWCFWVKFFVTSPVSDRNFCECARRLLPKLSEYEHAEIYGELGW